jgi:hypothetical protein
MPKKSKRIKEINVCPNCGSTDIESVYLMNPQQQTFFQVNNKMILAGQENPSFFGCKNCGFYGISPKIKETNLKKFQRDVSKRGPIKQEAPGINKNTSAVKWISILELISFLLFFISFAFSGLIGNMIMIISITMIVLGLILFIIAYRKL